MATKSGGGRAPGILNLPIGVMASGAGKESDSLGSVMVWMYRHDFQPTGGPLKMRACHTSELPLVFNTLDSAYGKAIIGDTPGAQHLADRMTDAWARFVKGEAPGSDDLPSWPRYHAAGREVMILDVDCRVERDPWGDLREAWTGVQ